MIGTQVISIWILVGTQVLGTLADAGVFGKLGGGAVPPGLILGGSLLEAPPLPDVVLFCVVD